jgi:lipopolysaccharide biosynthesis protein
LAKQEASIMIKPKKLCVFIHFSEIQFFPKYVEIFVKELSLYFDELILVTNKRKIASEANVQFPNVRIMYVQNEGYDLGMFHKAIQTVNLGDYSQVACINDSNILFKSLGPVFTWGEKHELDFWGLIDSYESPLFSTHHDNYHIQSHFIIFNKKAIDLLPKFFQNLQLETLFKEKDLKKLRENVINDWEIGLTQFFKQEGLKIGSYVDCGSFSEENNIKKGTNLSHVQYFRLIKEGYPAIKKRVVFQKKHLKFLFKPKIKWDFLIRKYGNMEWEIEELISELKKMKG